MPKSLPWHNNSVDPLLPDGSTSSIKPYLYSLDEYQTDDLVLFGAVSPKLSLAFPANFPITAFSNGFTLFERFTPFAHPWCEQYSTKFFNFVKKYAGTNLYQYGSSSPAQVIGLGVDFGDNAVNVDLSAYSVATQIDINIPATPVSKEIIIAWMELDSTQNREWIKRYVVIHTKNINFSFTLEVGTLLVCSIVVQASNPLLFNIVGQIAALGLGYLFDNLDDLFLLIDSFITQHFRLLHKVLSSVTRRITYFVNNYKLDIGGGSSLASEAYRTTGADISYTLTDIPGWYNPATIIYANNNYWNNEGTRIDLGANIKYYYLNGATNPRDRFYIASAIKPLGSKVPNYNISHNFLSNTSAGHTVNLTPEALNRNTYGSLPSEPILEGIYNSKIVKAFAYGVNVDNNHIDYYSSEYTVTLNKDTYSEVPVQVLLHTSPLAFSGSGFSRRLVQQDNFAINESKTLDYTQTYSYYQSESAYLLNSALSSASNNEFIDFLDKDIYKRDTAPYGEFDTTMPDSIRVKETHEYVQQYKEILGVNEWKAETDGVDPAKKINIWDTLSNLKKVLGILENPDRTVRSIRQKKIIKKGQPIPPGWYFAQWGRNTGADPKGQAGGFPSEQRLGIVYEVRSRKYVNDPYNPDKILLEPGDFVLCETVFQYLDEMLDDLDKAFGWEELAALPIPASDGSNKIAKYEGLASILSDLVFMVSKLSQHTSQTQISSLITQAVVYEILVSQGQPIAHKTFPLHITGDKETDITYPGLRADAPSAMRQTEWILRALAPLVANITKE